MPKEGSFAFEYCYAGTTDIPVAKKELTGGTFTAGSVIRAAQPGDPFAGQSGRCWGSFAVAAGKSELLGICEHVDQDGDKWWMLAHGNAEGGGTYTAPFGTGKYEGMVMAGEWREGPLPAPMSAGMYGCNPNKGTYKLK